MPKRYAAEKAFVLDSEGKLSDQINIVIFDRQYSPFLFNQNGALYVPAESVYCVLEIKQNMNKGNVEYASRKIASVRKLYRTSVQIPHAGGTHEPRPLFDILGGLLTLDNEWNPSNSDSFISLVSDLPKEKRVELFCCLTKGSFDFIYNDTKDEVTNIQSGKDESLIFFFLHLLHRLQQLGTVPAIDITAYADSI